MNILSLFRPKFPASSLPPQAPSPPTVRITSLPGFLGRTFHFHSRDEETVVSVDVVWTTRKAWSESRYATDPDWKLLAIGRAWVLSVRARV